MTISKITLLLAVSTLSPANAEAADQPSVPFEGAARATEVVELSLEQAITIARQRSFRAARSARNQEMADLRYGNAKSGYYPRADVRASADQSARGFQYDSDRFNYDSPTRSEFRSGVNASVAMPLDVFGIVKRQVSQADLQRQSTSYEASQAMLDVTLDAQNHYLNALRAQAGVDADERVVAEIEQLLVRSRNTARSTVPFLEVELGNAQQSLTSSRTNADQAQDGLRQSLRLPPETRLRLTSRIAEETKRFERGRLLERALAARPDVHQALNRIKQAEISERQTTDSRKPTVALGGFYGDSVSGKTLFDEQDRFRSHGAGLNVSFPLFQYDNGQLGRQRRVAQIQKEQAQADAEELQERVAYEVRQAVLAVERAENRMRTLPDPQQAYQALKRAEQSMVSAPDGQAQALLAQVSNARSAWRSAMTASADAHIDYNNAVFRLKRTIGDSYVIGEEKQVPEVALMSTGSASAGQ